MKKNYLRTLIVLIMCMSLIIPVFPQTAFASFHYKEEITIGDTTFVYEYTDSWDGNSDTEGTGGGGKVGSKGYDYDYEKAANIDAIIDICRKYSDRGALTGVRNQISWMNQLYVAVVGDFVSELSLGDALLLALLNHEDINKTLMKSSYSMGDINREIAGQIVNGVSGYVSVDDIAKSIGLSAQDVRDILAKIAEGSVTEKTITTGKNSSKHTNRGAYLNKQAERQEKVFNYLTGEVDRMTSDPDGLKILYQDLGSGYVGNLLSGQDLNQYQVELYKKNLAKLLDNVLEGNNPYSLVSYDITKKDSYKVAKKTRSALSKLYKYEIGAEEEKLSDDLKTFLEKHLDNDILSEKEAREYLILSGEYEKGEHGIGEAAKQLVAGHKQLKNLENTLKAAGTVFDAADKIKKVDEFINYWADDYAEQEIMLEYLVENLSNSDADMELMVAAKDLRAEYKNKMEGTFDKVYDTLIDKGIGTVKSTFPPLGIAETVISLAGTLTGADDHVNALETGFAMQGICKQSLEDYENAVIAVNKGDTSEEAVSRVLTTFETARQSMISYYEAMEELAETAAQKKTYSTELKRLEKAEFGYVVVAFGSMGGR